MGISAKQYQMRLQPILNSQTMEDLVKNIIVSDQKTLKEEKISEFEHGLKPDGKRIGQYRDLFYAQIKERMNPLAGGYVDLLLTRSFSNKMFLIGNNRKFIFDSSDSKTPNLKAKYGLEIMSISQQWFDTRQSNIYRLVLQQQIKDIYKIA